MSTEPKTDTKTETPSIAARTAKVLGRAVYATAHGLDKALTALADPALDRLYERNRARAMEDTEYAEIEARRHRRKDGYITLASSDDNLTMEHWDIQSTIEARTARHPWWEGPLRALRSNPFSKVVSAVDRRHQRAQRGWDHTALWSLDDHLSKTLGAQLIALADIAHGWPQSDEYPTYEDWVAALRDNGNALLAYGDHWDVCLIPGITSEEIRAKEDELRDNAKKALHWVADNLGALWD